MVVDGFTATGCFGLLISIAAAAAAADAAPFVLNLSAGLDAALIATHYCLKNKISSS